MTAVNKNRNTLKPYQNSSQIKQFETNSPTYTLSKFLRNHDEVKTSNSLEDRDGVNDVADTQVVNSPQPYVTKGSNIYMGGSYC